MPQLHRPEPRVFAVAQPQREPHLDIVGTLTTLVVVLAAAWLGANLG